MISDAANFVCSDVIAARNSDIEAFGFSDIIFASNCAQHNTTARSAISLCGAQYHSSQGEYNCDCFAVAERS